MAEWEQRKFNLSDRHRWEAKPGNRIFVADKGAVRFEIPGDWIVKPNKKSIKFFDGKPPNDDIRLEVSVIYLATYSVTVDWSQLPLGQLLKNVTDDSMDNVIEAGEPSGLKLGNVEIAWRQMELMDPGEKRPSYSRMCLAREARAGIQAFITIDYWPEDADRAVPVWNDVLGTLRMGEYIENPFLGPTG